MSFQASTASLVISVITLGLTIGCCLLSWRRAGSTRRAAFLEIFRFVLVVLVLVLLNQPEYRNETAPAEQPVVVVLRDASGSMQTQDVVSSESDSPHPMSRRDALEQITQRHFQSSPTPDLQLEVESFSANADAPDAGTDIATALRQTAEQYPDLRAIVLLSDGDWNTGEPPALAAAALRMQEVPVFAVGIGSERRLPDIAMESVEAPTFGVIGQTIRIPFRIASWLPEDRNLTVTLTGTGSDDVTRVVPVRGMGRATDTIDWQPTEVGDYQLTLQVPAEPGEAVAENNLQTFPVTIRQESLRVLLVETYPRWEYRYLRNALMRDPGVDVDCLLYHPDLDDVGAGRGYLDSFPGEAELFSYDVVFLGDVGIRSGQMSAQDAGLLRQLVRSHAGGLVFLPGFRGYQRDFVGSDLEELCPVVPDPATPQGVGAARASGFALTESGRRSLLTRLESDDEDNERAWNTLPGFHWYAAPLRARAGSQVLVTHDSASSRFGRIPLIATRAAGTGRVLYMGTDAAWRWRKGVEDLYHYRFWSQVVRWMAYQRKMSQGNSLRLFYSPDRPVQGKLVTLHANVLTESGEPLTDGTVVVIATAPSGESTTIRLAPENDNDNRGLYTGTWTPSEGGAWQLATTCQETGALLETSVVVQGRNPEQTGQPARMDVLREIAEVSRGQHVGADNVGELLRELSNLPKPRPLVTHVRLWSHPVPAALLILLLGLFWTARKAAGLA